MDEIEDRPYKTSEFAELVGVSDDTVRRWVDDGEVAKLNLPGKTIRIPASEVRRVLRPASGTDLTE